MAEYSGASFTTVTVYTDSTMATVASVFVDSGLTEPARNPFSCYGNYTVYGAAGLYVVHGDFTRLLGPTSGRTFWQYKAKTSATSGYPGDGYMLWDDATQINAGNLILSHITNDGLDIDIFLSFLIAGNTIIVQDANASQNNQNWAISGAPVNTNPGTATSYWTVPVTLNSSAGTGTTNFPNQHELFVVVFP